jgi:hypothetical protein
MSISRRSGWLTFGVMILLVLGSGACSTEAPAAARPEGAQLAGLDIKVYESPT